MRPIKFRGRVSDPTRRDVDQFIFGDLIHGPSDKCALKIKPPCKRAVDVYQDTIAQLVGFDVDGREVYEGDELVHYSETRDIDFTYRATLDSNFITAGAKLKEATS